MATIKMIVMHKECLHNHAATQGMGGYVVDGCGLFEASGPHGTPEASLCAVCRCHRNFHRRIEVVAPDHPQSHDAQPKQSQHGGGAAIPSLAPPHPHPQPQEMGPPPGFENPINPRPARSPGLPPQQDNRWQARAPERRRRITREQSDKLRAIAEKNGWKMFRDYSREDVMHTCSHVGVTRSALKSWISNHRRNKLLASN